MRRSDHGWVLLVLLISVAAPASEAFASGYALRTQSASAGGNAFAGAAAAAEDPSYMFYNPAALMFQHGDQSALNFAALFPSIEFSNGSASTVLATPIGGRQGRSAIPLTTIPDLYATFDLREDVRFGVAITAPFGVVTDYPRDWIGRYHGVRSTLTTVNVNPVIGVRPFHWLSIAGGLQIQYAKGHLTSAVDIGTVAAVLTGGALGIPGQQDGLIETDADDVGYGANLGVIIEPLYGTRIGVAYRSHISHKLRGDTDFILGPIGGAVQAASVVNGSGLFADTTARARFETPESISAGIYHEITPAVAVMGTVEWTNWRRNDEFSLKFGNPDQPDDITDFDWEDTWFFSVGTILRPWERWTFRAGASFDETPTRNHTREPRLPDEDRLRLAAGASFEATDRFRIDFHYAHMFFPDSASINLSATNVGSTFRGNLTGNYNSYVSVFAVQAVLDF